MQRRDWGERQEYVRLRRVRQGKTSGTRGSFCCCHYGSISEVDPANDMLESQLQITAETYHKACDSLEPILLLKTITAPPSSAKLSSQHTK